MYQRINVDLMAGGSRSFSGWYAAAALPVLGPPRERDPLSGTWVRPRTKGFINPRNGNWGAVELMARYSVADLRDGTVQGVKQRIWTLGTQWYVSPNLKLHLQYENGRIDVSGGNPHVSPHFASMTEMVRCLAPVWAGLPDGRAVTSG